MAAGDEGHLVCGQSAFRGDRCGDAVGFSLSTRRQCNGRRQAERDRQKIAAIPASASILPRSWHWARAAFSTRRSSKVLHAQPASLVATSKYVNAAENRVTNTGSSLLDGNVPRSVLGTQGAPVPVTPPHGPQSPRPCKRRRLLAWLRFLLLTIRIALGLAAQLKFA